MLTTQLHSRLIRKRNFFFEGKGKKKRNFRIKPETMNFSTMFQNGLILQQKQSTRTLQITWASNNSQTISTLPLEQKISKPGKTFVKNFENKHEKGNETNIRGVRTPTKPRTIPKPIIDPEEVPKKKPTKDPEEAPKKEPSIPPVKIPDFPPRKPGPIILPELDEKEINWPVAPRPNTKPDPEVPTKPPKKPKREKEFPKPKQPGKPKPEKPKPKPGTEPKTPSKPGKPKPKRPKPDQPKRRTPPTPERTKPKAPPMPGRPKRITRPKRKKPKPKKRDDDLKRRRRVTKKTKILVRKLSRPELTTVYKQTKAISAKPQLLFKPDPEAKVIEPNKVRATGRRKSAVARAELFQGNGQIKINQKPVFDYLQQNKLLLTRVHAPLYYLKLNDLVTISICVSGGGLIGQADAIKLAISRALCSYNKQYRYPLKNKGYLTRDARVKERKKYGLKKARKAPQFSKR